VLQALRDAGHPDETLVIMTVSALRDLPTDADLAALIARYLQRRAEGGAFDSASPAFVDEAGRPLAVATLGQYLRRLRSVTVNMAFNGALCRGLLAARFGEETPDDGSPGLRDFIKAAHAPR
jgi:hypothetical protein